MMDKFYARAPHRLADAMAAWFANDENRDFKEVLVEFVDLGIYELEERIGGEVCEFIRDTGYADGRLNGAHCFETKDNNWVIPVEILDLNVD